MAERTPKQWSRFEMQVTRYYVAYFWHFIKLNPNYPQDLENTLFQPFLEIYGTHPEYHPQINYFYEAAHLVKGNKYGAFYTSAMLDSIIKDQKLLLEKCSDFGVKFRDFLKKYHLYNEDFSEVSNNGLAEIVLTAVYLGNPKICNAGGFLPSNYPNDLLQELWETRPQSEWIEQLEKKIGDYSTAEVELNEYQLRVLNDYKDNIHPPKFLPPAQNFQFLPPFDISIDAETYEEEAVKAYRTHIRSYLNKIVIALKKHGFKQYKTDDYDQINRLVIWNSLNCDYLWESIQPIAEYEEDFFIDKKTKEKLDLNNPAHRKKAEDKLRKAFEDFEKLNLPVRPFGTKRKNKASKNR